MAKKLRIKPNVSLATKASNVLREFIFENYKDGGKIPGEHEFSEQLGVNRGTIRQALRTLEHEGIVIRRQGDGTYANSHVIGINSRIDEITEYKELIRKSGYEASTVLLEVTNELAAKEIALKLGVDLHSPLLVSRNILFANGNPAIYVEDKIPIEFIKEKYDQQELEDSVFDFLENRCFARVSYTVSEFIPRRCGEKLSQILKVEPWQTLLQSTGIVYSEENNPIMHSTTYYRDPFIRFHIVRNRKY